LQRGNAMKRKIMAVLIATVVAFGGVGLAAVPAQAATCYFLHPAAHTPGYATVTNNSCSNARAGMQYQNPVTGTKTTTWSTWAAVGKTKSTGAVNASWVLDRFSWWY